jgi:hypothetical protein
VGLGLAQAGLPAVLTVPGCGPVATMDRLLALFFCELRREGRLDRALAVARDIEHSAMHLGHLQLTRPLAQAQPDDGPPAAVGAA